MPVLLRPGQKPPEEERYSAHFPQQAQRPGQKPPELKRLVQLRHQSVVQMPAVRAPRRMMKNLLPVADERGVRARVDDDPFFLYQRL